MFSSDFFQNVIVCFTNFSFDNKSMKRREEGKESKQEELIEEMKNEFKNRFTYDLNDEQFAFIDNSVLDSDPNDLDEEEKINYDKALEDILSFTNKQKPFFCKDIKEVMKENDALNKKFLNWSS